MHSKYDFLEGLNDRPAFFDEIKPIDQLTQNEAFESKFNQVPPRPVHPILKFALVLGILLGICAIASLDYKHHILIDLSIVFFISIMQWSDFVDFNYLTIGATILFLLISFAVELTWFLIYTKKWWNSVYIDDGSLVTFRRY